MDAKASIQASPFKEKYRVISGNPASFKYSWFPLPAFAGTSFAGMTAFFLRCDTVPDGETESPVTEVVFLPVFTPYRHLS